MEGMVFNIQKFSVHDGPGIRSIVFLKGCPLACRWCSNPEGIHKNPQFFFREDRCIGENECGLCKEGCKKQAIQMEDGRPVFLRELCGDCTDCAEVCPSKAIERTGRWMTPEEVLEEVLKDDGFYSRSGGGLTLSGGEPLLQAEFAAELLDQARKSGLTSAIETTGCVSWEQAEPVFRRLDVIHYDLKSMDTEKHRQFTGVGNELPKENFQILCKTFPEKPIIVRTPVIPGFNDTPEDIQKIIDFIAENRGEAKVIYELLPYHAFGVMKYQYLGRTYLMEEKNMDKKIMDSLKNHLIQKIPVL